MLPTQLPFTAVKVIPKMRTHTPKTSNSKGYTRLRLVHGTASLVAATTPISPGRINAIRFAFTTPLRTSTSPEKGAESTVNTWESHLQRSCLSYGFVPYKRRTGANNVETKCHTSSLASENETQTSQTCIKKACVRFSHSPNEHRKVAVPRAPGSITYSTRAD